MLNREYDRCFERERPALSYVLLKDNARPLGEDIVSPADGKALAFQSLGEVPSFFIM